MPTETPAEPKLLEAMDKLIAKTLGAGERPERLVMLKDDYETLRTHWSTCALIRDPNENRVASYCGIPIEIIEPGTVLVISQSR